jgi:hypothetical protein
MSTAPTVSLPTRLATTDIHHCPGCGRPLPPPRVRCGPCVAAAWLSLGWAPQAATTDPVETLGSANRAGRIEKSPNCP